MGMGKGKPKDFGKPMPDEFKIPAAMLTPERAAWVVVYSRRKRGKTGGALSLFTGQYRMFSGGSDAELQRVLSTAAVAHEADFTVSQQAAQNLAQFELANPDFVAAVKRAAEWASAN